MKRLVTEHKTSFRMLKAVYSCVAFLVTPSPDEYTTDGTNQAIAVTSNEVPTL
ncbi:hypothetical protein [Listeria fleischmannii]|uniref:hypothetical protein n=1 Tax=Listeria fleischmannii TaxID=1069827 RepID=UPI0013E3FAA1|nr:hypothetical protein [Listeria fleischmannii]